MSLTPEGHEDGEEHGGRVVKEMAGTRRATRCAQMPVVTCSITKGTHSEILVLVTHLLAGRNTHRKHTCTQLDTAVQQSNEIN